MDEQSAVPQPTGVADVFDLHEVTAAATAEPVGECRARPTNRERSAT